MECVVGILTKGEEGRQGRWRGVRLRRPALRHPSTPLAPFLMA